MNKIGLVLEGGGMRGAYTAGALSWLIDNNIEMDYGVGISAGAVNICCYYMKNKEYLYDITAVHTADSRNVGIKPIVKEGRYVGYRFMFDELLRETLKFDVQELKDKDSNFEIGLYDLDKAETFYIKANELDNDLVLLKAACTLPIAGNIVEYQGQKLLDGGITTMIPYERSIENGNDKHFVIVTKPEGYVRKAASGFMRWFMNFNYPNYPKLVEQYSNRHEAYNKQMAAIEQGVKDNNTFLLRPSSDIPVKRFSGDPENLKKLFELGYKDMEDRKAEILSFIKG